MSKKEELLKKSKDAAANDYDESRLANAFAAFTVYAVDAAEKAYADIVKQKKDGKW
ncbi:MAG: hypothetical protein GY797_33495 [Deltaproteobacteria bacterium]|nr:hypothetical protein [Deltaproteobacteria bacterium]